MALSSFSMLLLVLITINLPPSVPDSDDKSCLVNLYNSIEDPTGSLVNWTRSTFSAPCNGVISYLKGATCKNNRIYKLTLSNLSLHGFISPYISNCSNLQTLDLSSNRLTGPIPAEIASLINLVVINLASNLLSGQIPPTISQCVFLNVIDLRENLLEGLIPPEIGFLNMLTFFNVSYNRLSGPIPTSFVNLPRNRVRFNASCFVGNKGLFGYPLVGEKRRRVPILMIVGIGLVSGVVSLAMSFFVVCVLLRITEEQRAIEERAIVGE